MKKLYTTVLFLACAAMGLAQSAITKLPTGIPSTTTIKGSTKIPSTMAIDTLWPPSSGMPCDTILYYYVWDAATPLDSGYAFGNNVFGATECAQKYSGTGSVVEVISLVGYKTSGSGTTSAKVYAVDGSTKKPSTVLGTSSNSITMANLSTTAYNSYTFSPPVSVSGAFAAAVVLPAGSDSIALLSTQLQCAGTDTLSWTQYPAGMGGWNSTINALAKILGYPYSTLAAANFDVDLCIYPVVDLASSLNEYVSQGNLTLFGAFPSPASQVTSLKYELANASEVSIRVFDLSGKEYENYAANLPAGTHEYKVNVKNLAAGNYYYSIRTDRGTLNSKFSVVK